MYLIAEKVFIVFIYIGIGFFFNRIGRLPIEANKYLNAVVMDIAAPCLMIGALSGQKVMADTLHDTIVVFFLELGIFSITAIITMKIADLICRNNKPDANVLAVAMTGCNCGFMGMPIAKSVFGNLSLYYMIICNIVLNLYLFTISIMQLNRGSTGVSHHFSFKEFIRPFANPVSIASIASVILLFSGISLPTYPMTVIRSIGDVCIPLSMIVVGIQLGESDIRKLLKEKALFVTSAIKLIVLPAFATAVIVLLGIKGTAGLTLALSTTFPSAVMGVVLAASEKKNAKLMAEAVASTTFFSLVTLPVWIYLLSLLFL